MISSPCHHSGECIPLCTAYIIADVKSHIMKLIVTKVRDESDIN
jgi:hypothetical protein